MGRPSEEGGAACSVVPTESSGLKLQTSTVAVPAFLRLEALSSSEYGYQLLSELQRGNADYYISLYRRFYSLCVKEEMLTFVPCIPQAVHIFALEKENTALGQRVYLVTSYSELWHYYR